MTTIGEKAVRVPATGSYLIDPEDSVVRFRTRAIFGLLPVHGTMRVGGGKVRVADPPEASGVHAVVRADTIDTANEERDNHVRSADFLDTGAFPDFVFDSDRLEIAGKRPKLHGRLTVRGVTRPVTLTLDAVTESGGRLRARATTRIDRYAFGVTRAKGMTGRRLTVTVEVTAVR